MTLTTSQIAEKVGGQLIGDPAISISGIGLADSARPGDIVFADKENFFAAAEASAAGAILVSGPFTSATKTLIRVPNARVAVARLLPLFFPSDPVQPGIHPTAVVDGSAEIDPTAQVGPFCAIGPRAKIGARTVLSGGNHIGADCRIGDDSILAPRVVLYARTQVGSRVIIHAGTVIGSDGFGYVFDEGRHRKVLQIGNVIIQDDVEIGANVAIDRGALGPTTIGKGTKMDNLIHVAHNVSIGKNCLVMGQAGFAGSTRLGDYAIIAAQAGIAGHLTLGNQSVVGAKSGVMRDVPDGTTVLGIPAAPDRQTKRQWIAIQQLPDLARRFKELEKEIAALKDQLRSSEAGS